MAIPGLGQQKSLGGSKREISSEPNNYTEDLSVIGSQENTTLKDVHETLENSNVSTNPNLVAGQPYGMDELSNADGKIICTTIYETTGLTDWKEKSRLWNKHLNKHLTKYHQIGYHALFYQFTLLMKKYKLIFKLGKYMTVQRSKDLEAVMNNKQRHLPGMIVRYIFEPICYLIGKFKGA